MARSRSRRGVFSSIPGFYSFLWPFLFSTTILPRPVRGDWEEMIKVKYNIMSVNNTGGIATWSGEPSLQSYCPVELFIRLEDIADKRRLAYVRNARAYQCGTCMEVCGDLGCEYVMLWDHLEYDRPTIMKVSAELRPYLTGIPENKHLAEAGANTFSGSWWPVEAVNCRDIFPNFYQNSIWEGWKDYWKAHWVWAAARIEPRRKFIDDTTLFAPPWKHWDMDLKRDYNKMWRDHRKRLARTRARILRHRYMHHYGSHYPNPVTPLNYTCNEPWPEEGPPQGAALTCQSPEPWQDEPIQHQALGMPINETVDTEVYRDGAPEMLNKSSGTIEQTRNNRTNIETNRAHKNSTKSTTAAHRLSKRWESLHHNAWEPKHHLRGNNPRRHPFWRKPPKDRRWRWVIPYHSRLSRSRLFKFVASFVMPIRKHSRMFTGMPRYNHTHHAHIHDHNLTTPRYNLSEYYKTSKTYDRVTHSPHFNLSKQHTNHSRHEGHRFIGPARPRFGLEVDSWEEKPRRDAASLGAQIKKEFSSRKEDDRERFGLPVAIKGLDSGLSPRQ